MPSDDVILNLKQIAGYGSTGVGASDTFLFQRGGLGGPYYSVTAVNLVGAALASGGILQVGAPLPPGPVVAPDTVLAGVLALEPQGFIGWNAYWSDASNAEFALASGSPAGLLSFDGGGWHFQSSVSPSTSTSIAWVEPFSISLSGYVTVADQVLLGRDPQLPMEAATANWVTNQIIGSTNVLMSMYNTNTVWTFNNRSGQVILNLCDVMGAGGAPINSPAFTGQPTAPLPAPAANDGEIATTQWVWQAVTSSINQGAVASFNGRSGAVVLTMADITALGPLPYAPLASPQFSGIPTAPTASSGSRTGQLATTAFVMNAVTAATAGVSSFNTRTGAVVLSSADITGAGGALIASPSFTGVPLAPTASPSTNSQQVATCAFVMAQMAAGGVTSFNTRVGAVTLTGADVTAAGGALLASPALSGVPTAPTATAGTSTTQLATCAFVTNAVTGAGGIVNTFNGRSGTVQLLANDISSAGGAALASPAFTGTPTAPTPVTSDSSTTLATTAFVKAALAAAGVSSWNGRSGVVTMTLGDVTGVLPASTTVPVMNGTATPGTANTFSRGDHVHPTDTSLYPASNPSGFQTATQLSTALSGYLPLAGGTMTGTLNGVAVSMTGDITTSAGNITAGAKFIPASVGSGGYASKAGTAGGVDNHTFNINWNGSYAYLWIDAVNQGSFAYTSDYRVKKDVRPLGSMWERVKSLRPVSYTQRDYNPPGATEIENSRGVKEPLVVADDIERWGFVAHELQDTLIASAASGVKDQPDAIQSPNPWTVLAAVTKVLQEAMERIEALEARMA